ncbi:hypothetical protein V6N13_125993 [Hibiscus sabdariffa]
MKQGSREDGIVNEAGDLNSPIWMKKKRITGHVEEEDLWKMRRCLVGGWLLIPIRGTEDEVDRSWLGTEEEEIQARWVERNCINGDSRDKETSRGHIKFLELVGGVPKDTGALDGVGSGEGDFREVEEPVKIFERNVAAYHTSPIHEKLGGDLDIGSDLGRGLEARPCRNYTPLSGLASNGVERVAETIFAVKLDPKENVGGDVNGQKKSYAERINKNVNLGFSDARDPIEEDKDESGREIFTDLEVSEGKQRKRRVKKYGSLLDIQNKSISEKERRRRDKALKKRIWSKEILEQTELLGKSLSDSDINNRVSKIISEAKERPWGIARNLAEFDSLVCDCLSFRFQFADLMKSSLAVLLAQDGFNRNDSRDCEKLTVLISTDQVKKIEEVVQIEVGDKIFEIVVVELGFSTVLGKKVIVDKVNCDVIQESESETDTTSLQDKKEVVDDDRRR